MRGTYRALFGVPGARAFFVAGFVGRMSLSMYGIGILLLVSAVTGSYGTAGAVAAAFAIASATATPLAGRLADRSGQHVVLLLVSAGTAASTSALIACAELAAPAWALGLAAAALGLASPSPAGIVRARWNHALSGPGRTGRTVRTEAAYSLESVADEVIFVLGPVILIGATWVHQSAGLATAGVLTVAGCLALAVQRGTEPVPRPRADGEPAGALLTPGMLLLSGVFLLLGAAITAVEVGGVAFADDAGHRGAAGALLSLFALGSMSAGLWYGARHWRTPLARRFRAGLAFFAAGLLPVALARGLPMMMAAVLIAGLAISPTFIAGFGLVERLAPAGRLTEGMSWLTTAIRVGVTASAPVVGWIVDERGVRAALAVPCAVALLTALVGLACSGALRAPAPVPEPGLVGGGEQNIQL